METLYVRVYEVEHEGDMSDALADIREAGGKVYERPVCDYEGEESCMFKVEVESKSAFRARYSKTDTFDFSNQA